MDITEVRVKLIDDPSERLKAFCSITFNDCFVVRDLKIIDGVSGPFVAMPSRKLTAHCPHCRCKNHVRAGYCNQCGAKLPDAPLVRDEEGRAKLYADIAHPINSECRELIQQAVIEAYEKEKVLAAQPNYVCRYDDFDYPYNPTETRTNDNRPPYSSQRAAAAAAPGTKALASNNKSRDPKDAPSLKTDYSKGFGVGIFAE